jgi:tetratricopeptide (TPR) repeat protein
MYRSTETAISAMQNFQQAVQLDPSYAAAWAGLARMAMRVAFDKVDDNSQLLALAERAALQAVELDATLADANATMGLLRLRAFDLPAAETWMSRAVALDPARGSAREWLVGVYLWTARPSLALAEAERAVQLDPLSPTASAELARALAANGRCVEALQRLTPLAELDPPLLRVPLIAAQCHAQLGMWQRAIAELGPAMPGSGAMLHQAFIAYATARSAPPDEARQLRETLLAQWRENSSAALALAMLHAGQGETGEAIAWLERAIEHDKLWATPDLFTLLQPVLESLRGDPHIRGLPLLPPQIAPLLQEPAAPAASARSS